MTREPTEAELRGANALLREVAIDAGSPPMTNALAMLRPDTQAKVLRQVRAVIRSLRTPTPEMVEAYIDVEPIDWKQGALAENACAALIDAASPEAT